MNHSLLLFGFALGLGWRVATIAFYIVYLLFFYKRKMRKTGRQIPLGTKIGGGLRLIHYGLVVIHRNAIIG